MADGSGGGGGGGPPRSPELDRVIVELMMGLTTDGEQQKQCYLERALRALVEDQWVDRARANPEVGWKSSTWKPSS